MRHLIILATLAIASSPILAKDCDPTAMREQLLKRNATDQVARKALLADKASEQALNTVLRIDADNTAFMRQLLVHCGWPERSAVGEEAAKAAWRLTQHADMDPQYQVLAAQQLKHAVLAKEAEPWDLAVLVDRNRRLNDQPQVYGMQFYSEPDGVIEFYDIVSPARLDDRRKAIGLEPFFCWALRVSKMNSNAAIRWPVGMLVKPSACADDP